jgi:aryl-alcohol dehydrogenase-like predicted oxidoreductase
MSGAVQYRQLGETGLEVSRLGIGLSEIGFRLTPDEVDLAAQVLNQALDSGITFMDTAGCYSISEELVGATVSARRNEFVLASKTGHLGERCDGDSWSYDCVLRSIERSLVRLKTDHVDLMQLHSCTVGELERGEAIRALQDARAHGLVNFIGYSGDNEAVVWAADSGLFDVIQTSFNIVDQGARRHLFNLIRTGRLGLIAKRPIANNTWTRPRFHDPNGTGYGSEYFERQKRMRDAPFAGEPDDPVLAALGFTLAHDEVDTAIVGSTNPDHVKSNAEMMPGLSVPAAFVDWAHERFDEVGQDWNQIT